MKIRPEQLVANPNEFLEDRNLQAATEDTTQLKINDVLRAYDRAMADPTTRIPLSLRVAIGILRGAL